jgi:hypothetical protein
MNPKAETQLLVRNRFGSGCVRYIESIEFIDIRQPVGWIGTVQKYLVRSFTYFLGMLFMLCMELTKKPVGR